MKLREMDEHTAFLEQLQEGDGPIVLFNQFNVPPEDTERFLEVWADDAAFMKQQPGFISTQLHRGTAGSSTFMNVAVWESAKALGQAFRSPEFQARAARYPDGAVAGGPAPESARFRHPPAAARSPNCNLLCMNKHENHASSYKEAHVARRSGKARPGMFTIAREPARPVLM